MIYGETRRYLQDLTALLREAPRSRPLISTRDRNIADNAGESVEFSPMKAEDSKAREILLTDIPGLVNVANISDEATDDCIRHILTICAGLPLALVIARYGLSKAMRDSNPFRKGVRRYCEAS